MKAFLITFVLNIKNMQSFSGIFNFQGIQSFDLLKKLGFTNVHIYFGGLFEWLLLKEVYGSIYGAK